VSVSWWINMRLDRLEIHGFKSFSDRSELAFDKGVTAIVGPNGCGKSNVADAITWVMGEQSAKSLRGERMEDVIFNGSDARKPTASAEVRLRLSDVRKLTVPAFEESEGHSGNGHALADGSGNNGHEAVGGQPLVLDALDAALVGNELSGDGNDQTEVEDPLTATGSRTNGHGNGNGNGNGYHGHEDVPANTALPAAEELIRSVVREVEVTRRLYRSGESEYLIDGHVCRLRDVHELLMDTGLGAKAYAIIEQGKIGLILSSRPTDRRQLIEEAAGVTKYKARRRAAELKLEAAQQNLTRVDDIVFEVEKQRGTLKRQASKARRYQKLRAELRRWEKVLFARKHAQLAETITSARARLAEARVRELAAATRLSALESDGSRIRIELVEVDTRATAAREAAHTAELAIDRQQQRLAFDREQIETLDARGAAVSAELQALTARREPAIEALAARRAAAAEAEAARAQAAETHAVEAEAYEGALQEIEGFEADVEAARSEVFSAINAATALTHTMEHTTAARVRVSERLSTLDIEVSDLRVEADRVALDRAAAQEGLHRVQTAIEATRVARSARDSELASARVEHEWRDRSVRAREHEIAGLEARLKSLEELDASRSAYGDAARVVLAQANAAIAQSGAVADYLDVEAGYERAVEGCLGELLQHVIVEHPAQAEAGLDLVRRQDAGRCGFLVTPASAGQSAGNAPGGSAAADGASLSPTESKAGSLPTPAGVVTLSSVTRVNGPFADAIRRAMGDAWIVDAFAQANDLSALTSVPVVTREGDVFRGPGLVTGGGRQQVRGILEMKREIKDLNARITIERDTVATLREEAGTFECMIAQTSAAIDALAAEDHRLEKAVVGFDLQLQRAHDETSRLEQRAEQFARERRLALEEREGLDRRQQEVREALARLEGDQRAAEEHLNGLQRRLLEGREQAEDLNRRAADAHAVHAAMAERSLAMATEVGRLQEAAAELDERVAALATELAQTEHRVAELRASTTSGTAQLDADIRALEDLRLAVQAADDAVSERRVEADAVEAALKGARAHLDGARSTVAELDVVRATAEADLSNLAAACLDAVQSPIDEVVAEAEQLEREGGLPAGTRALCSDEADEPVEEDDLPQDAAASDSGDLSDPGAAVHAAEEHTLGAEDAIAALRARIERLGPVNMMAIEQFDELETRHTFLSEQRNDLVESIRQTADAVKRIDRTTHQRFVEAFNAINHNFQEVFSSLFGGGRAGLSLLDESDPLESGIEIIAQPPGKHLQSVQLLSGGEKALTAIALMFAMFQFKPSPFCLLDEIDAPLDDANIGRFVEMLRGMQDRTQFIVITHNRKTMEIANRLYGVTMEEPGVSKLISVQLN
jgi:chromosome segregation protein